jgi:HPt (histidine-containing phosphotransfer) domain-containing protein
MRAMKRAGTAALHRRGSRRRPLNAAHLRRQTLGDTALAAELLDLFAVQCRQVLQALDAGPCPSEAAALAHALTGAARAIGARDVAAAAQAAEHAAAKGAAAWVPAAQVLAAAVAAALAALPRRGAS